MECGVCLDPLDGKAATRLDPCGHLHHEECLAQWESDPLRADICPACRKATTGRTTAGGPAADRGNECPICMEDMTEGAAKTQPCDHRFHFHCFLGWQEQGHSDCPLCRGVVSGTVPDEPEKPPADPAPKGEDPSPPTPESPALAHHLRSVSDRFQTLASTLQSTDPPGRQWRREINREIDVRALLKREAFASGPGGTRAILDMYGFDAKIRWTPGQDYYD